MTTRGDSIMFQMRPTERPEGVSACWTIHCDDGFSTQIGTRLEDRGNEFRMVFKNEKSVTVDTQRDAMILIQGLLLGRCLC